MREHEIWVIDWDRLGHDELIEFCRRWNGEKLLFRKIVDRAVVLVYRHDGELAEEIGVDSATISHWRNGNTMPSKDMMLLIITDVIQVRLEACKNRLASATMN